MNTVLAFVFCLSLGHFVRQADMAYQNVTEFFNLTNSNLTSVTWAHAVNSKSLLSQALNSNVMMIEADVVIGAITGTNTTDVPIMAHPPSTTSDLSLETFLNDIYNYNQNTSNALLVKKGVKLDFKTIEAFENSTQDITNLYNSMTYPVWINADIISGPLNSATTPVDPVRFFTAAKSFQNSTLSIGWTTLYGANYNATSYTNTQITNMLNSITANNVDQSITYPVRAGIAAESLTQMQTLLNNTSGSTLTIWSSEGDPVNVTKLRELIAAVGLNKTYIDVPEDLQEQLNLQTIGSANMATPITKLLLAILVVLCVF